ncbi:MAG TPA: hypothetical protein VKU00_18020 [Chthonomonadaceae bacterium]|nr:hypothetical protein [Chthonomonadaceae bacterium]
MSSIGGVTASVSAGLISQAEQNPGVAATLLNKALQADKDLVATLLPPTPSLSTGLDIRA